MVDFFHNGGLAFGAVQYFKVEMVTIDDQIEGVL